MPGKIKLRVISARNLPIMDRGSDSCDAFVEVIRVAYSQKSNTPIYKYSFV
jgi:hypothetical protein